MDSEFLIYKELQHYYTLWRECNAVYEHWAKEHGLSLNSLLILYSVCEEDTFCTQKRICQEWLIPKQTVHAVLKEFEERGYIRLTPTENDRRNKQIFLTETGKQFAGDILSELHSNELYITEQMGIENLKSMNENLMLFIKLFRKGALKEDG